MSNPRFVHFNVDENAAAMSSEPTPAPLEAPPAAAEPTPSQEATPAS